MTRVMILPGPHRDSASVTHSLVFTLVQWLPNPTSDHRNPEDGVTQWTETEMKQFCSDGAYVLLGADKAI